MRSSVAAAAVAVLCVLLTGLLMAAPSAADDLRPPSRPGDPYIFSPASGDQLSLAWSRPTRTGSHPIRRYVIRWSEGRLVVPASRSHIEVPRLNPGRHVFRVKAVSRAGASPWARSLAVYAD